MLAYVYKKTASVASHKIGEEVILIPLRRDNDSNCLYKLNGVAAFIWEKIDGELTVTELAHIICSAFAAELAQVEDDLIDLLQQLNKIGAVDLMVPKAND